MAARTALSVKERHAYSKLRQIFNSPNLDLIRGNLVTMRRQCGKATCRCQDNPEYRHESLYLGLSLNGKHKMVYVPSDWEKRIRDWVTRYAQVRDLLEEICLGSLERLQKRKG